MTTKKLLAFGSSIIGSLLLFVVIGLVNTQSASAATKTWDGGAGDNNMMTDANWNADSAPVAGDDLVFPMSVSDKTVVNDFTAGTSFNSITFNGTSSSVTSYQISGNQIAVADNITENFTGTSTTNIISASLSFPSAIDIAVDHTLYLTGVVSGSGAISYTGGVLYFSNHNTFSGSVTINSGSVFATYSDGMGTAAGATILNGTGAYMSYSMPASPTTATISEPFTITNIIYGSLTTFGNFGVSFACSDPVCGGTVNFTGAFTLSKDLRFASDATITMSGTLSGSHNIGMGVNQSGTLIVNSSSNGTSTANGTYRAPVYELELSGNLPSATFAAKYNTTFVLTGVRGAGSVTEGGRLKGTGTSAALHVYTGGVLAPGLSPGCLTSGNLIMAGTLEVEIGGADACTGYDQQIVNGTVNLTGGELETIAYNGYVPPVGQTFTIIENDGTDAVTGTFNDLPEGSAFYYDDGVVYEISYVGGSGNDVTLTVLEILESPDTGFGLIKNNPAAIVAITSACAIVITLIAKKYKAIKART